MIVAAIISGIFLIYVNRKPRNINHEQDKNHELQQLDATSTQLKRNQNLMMSLLDEYIVQNSVLRNYLYNRYVAECEAVVQMLNVATPTEIDTLDAIANEFTFTQDSATFRELETRFHGYICSVAKSNINDYDLWSGHFVALEFQNLYFDNILSVPASRDKVITIHKDIVQSIKLKNQDMAISSTQEYFSFLLFSLISIVLQKELV